MDKDREAVKRIIAVIQVFADINLVKYAMKYVGTFVNQSKAMNGNY